MLASEPDVLFYFDAFLGHVARPTPTALARAGEPLERAGFRYHPWFDRYQLAQAMDGDAAAGRIHYAAGLLKQAGLTCEVEHPDPGAARGAGARMEARSGAGPAGEGTELRDQLDELAADIARIKAVLTAVSSTLALHSSLPAAFRSRIATAGNTAGLLNVDLLHAMSALADHGPGPRPTGASTLPAPRTGRSKR